MTCVLPNDVNDDEFIVRLIRTPCHLKKNKLKAGAFRSQAGEDDVSVVRHTHMGTYFCKSKAKEIMGVNYVGLAIVGVLDVRSTGSAVADTREEYCGHASIMHGVVLEREEPPESELNEFITERCRNILRFTTYYEDPEPHLDKWTGKVF